MQSAPLVPASTAARQQFNRLCITTDGSKGKKARRAQVHASAHRLKSSAALVRYRAKLPLYPFQGRAAARWRPNPKGSECVPRALLRNQNTFLTCLSLQTGVARIQESRRSRLLVLVWQRRVWGAKMQQQEEEKEGRGRRGGGAVK